MDEFLKLTELINKVILKGNMDIYQETYEMIKLKVSQSIILKINLKNCYTHTLASAMDINQLSILLIILFLIYCSHNILDTIKNTH